MSLDSLFDHVNRLPSIPSVVLELITSLDDTNSDIRRISANLRKDPTLSLKLLRAANSVRYGGGRNVSSVDDALLLLGFDRARTLVITAGMVGAFKSVPGLDHRVFWQQSLSVASFSRSIARHSGRDDLIAETAFTSGILHHVGSALMHIAHPELMTRIDKLVARGAPRDELEASQFGFTYSDVGARLGRRWRFPETICNALAFQSSPIATEPFSPYAAVLHLAIGLNEKLVNGQREEYALGEMPKDVRRPLALDLLSLYEVVLEQVRESDELELFLD